MDEVVGLEGLESYLEGIGYEALEPNFRCILEVEELPAAPYREALRRLDGELREHPCARLHALKGKVLSNLSRFAEARRELQRSLALDAGQAGAHAWLGAVRLFEGSFEMAVESLDRAVGLDPGCAWAYFYRAAARFGEGSPAQAREDLGRILALGEKEGPAWSAAQAFLGLLAMGEARWEEALQALNKVVERLPSDAWPYALRARVHKGRGDLAACLRDFRAAVEGGGAAWIHLERSRLHEEMGDMPRALEDVDRALLLAGPRAELFMRRAHLQVCRRHYHLAVPEYTKALEAEPGSVPALLGRSMVHCIRGDMDAALEDATRAEEASGGDPQIALDRLRMRIYAGRLEGVSRELDALGRKHRALAAQARFLKGCGELKRRSYARAAAELEGALSPDRGSDFDLKVGFHLAIARGLRGTLPGTPRLPSAKARLLICGLGIRPPFTASLETLRAIGSCDFIFNNLSEPEIAALLCLLSAEVRPTMFDVRGADARWTRTIFKEIRPGRTVGFVTRGHPLVCGGLAGSLIAECGRTGTEYMIYGSVSSMNTLAIGALPDPSQGFWGQQVMDYSTAFERGFRLETRIPAVIYFNATVQEMPRKDYDRFCSVLEACYSPRQPCYFYGRNFGMAPDLIELRELRDYHTRLDPSYTLLIPPKP